MSFNRSRWEDNVIYVDSSEKLKMVVNWVYDREHIALDTETTGLRFHADKVLLLQLGDTHVQYVLDMYKLEGNPMMKPVWEGLCRPGVTCYAHNAKFDFGMIMGHFGIEIPRWVCTYIASELLSKGIKSSSSSLVYSLDKYLGEKVDKSAQASFQDMSWGDSFTEEQIEYAASDVKYLLPLWQEQKKQMDRWGMDKTRLYEMEFECIKACADLEYNGIYINQDKWLELKAKAVKIRDEVLEKLDEHFIKICPPDMFGRPIINYKSPAQVKPALSKLIDYKLPDTSEGTLSQFKEDHDVVDLVLKYRKSTKLVDTYGSEFLRKNVDPITFRIHSDFRQTGTETGRMASRNPNLQNIPSQQEYRDPFEVQDPENYRIISADFSGQELRLLIQISKEPALIKAVKENKDVHSYSASLVFGIPYEDFLTYDEEGNVIYDDEGEPVIKPDMKKSYRNPCKSITFGLIYGMGVQKLANTLGITISEAKELREKYFAAFPKVKALMDSIEAETKRTKMAYSPLDGRIKHLSFMDWDHPKHVGGAINQAKNFPFQGCGASTTKLAMARLRKRIKRENWDARLVNVVHDELIFEVHKDQANDFSKVVAEEMSKAFNVYAPDVPMTAKPEIGLHWIH